MRDPNAVAKRLRAMRPPLVGRVDGDRVMLDLRTLPPERDGEVATILECAIPR